MSKDNSDNSLVHRYIIWSENVLMKQMDKFAYLRTIVIFTLVSFFIGENLNVYLYLFIGITIYMLILRFIRWTVKKWLLYMLEFCYFGITFFTYFLLFEPNNKSYWFINFTFSCGNMAIAAFVFNNSAQFSSTDHISSAWLHFAPMMTSWAIRWRHIIYKNPNEITFNIISEEDMSLHNEEIVKYFFFYPSILWFIWMIMYVLILYILLEPLISKYDTGLTCFLGLMKKFKFLFRDNFSGIKWKYLVLHFLLFVVGLPFAFLCYNYFYFHCFYILFMITILFHNASVQQSNYVEKLNKKRKE